MGAVPPSDVIAAIRSPSVRVKTGIWTMPLSMLGAEEKEAARLQVDAVDLRTLLLSRMPAGSRFAALTVEKVIELLDDVAQGGGASDCALVYNVDLLLAALGHVDRQFLWSSLYSAFPHRPRALLIAMPAGATELLPSPQDLDQWNREKRVAGGGAMSSEGGG